MTFTVALDVAAIVIAPIVLFEPSTSTSTVDVPEATIEPPVKTFPFPESVTLA